MKEINRKSMNKSYIDIMRGLREDNDKTQQDIADFLGISQTMYARYERGANELPIRHLIKLCQYYHVSADYFLDCRNTSIKKVNPSHLFKKIDVLILNY